MQTEYPERTFVVMPTIGKMLVHIKKHNKHHDQSLDYYLVMIGTDPRNACVSIRVPADSNEPMVMAYITSEVVCTLDNITPMKGLATVQMIQLGITIARELSPETATMELEDCSHFQCRSPDGKHKKMALPSFHIAFHGKTWYEEKFGAILKDPKLREIYRQGIASLDAPEAKPATFRFLNPELSELLYPLYTSSNTWNEFFRKIKTKYGNERCWIVQPWIEDAMRHVFGGLVYEMQKWVIDLKQIPTISYYELKEEGEANLQLGGGWKNPFSERVMQRSSFYTDMHFTEYKRLLKRNTTRRHANRNAKPTKRTSTTRAKRAKLENR